MKRLVILRRTVQTSSLLLFAWILWSTTYPLSGPLPPETFFHLDPLITIVTSLSERILIPGFFISCVMIVLTLIGGRFFCGWICPLGAAIDLTGTCTPKKREATDAGPHNLGKIKFYLLGIILIAALFGFQAGWILDPIVIMARFLSLNLIPALTSLVNTAFVLLIKSPGSAAWIYDLYRSLKSSFLGINIYYFSHSFVILAFFILVVATTLISRRFWCRNVCPLGALYALISRFSPLKRVVAKCVSCSACHSRCRMAAIHEDYISYSQGECILCMDCVYECPGRLTRFSWKKELPGTRSPKEGAGQTGKGAISRGQFLYLLCAIPFMMGARRAGPVAPIQTPQSKVIRPPGALPEEEFIDRCIRCGNCMKVCITNGLQPVMFESGIEGVWTPQLVPEIGYCEYNCTLCGHSCPTGAIERLPLEKKRLARLGTAIVDKSICIAWAQHKDCLVCEEHCPVAEKAIKTTTGDTGDGVLKPVVDPALCIGCGTCQSRCPVRPVRAIRVIPR